MAQPSARNYVLSGNLLQRAAAAFFAISLRFRGLKAAALAAPPFLPPRRPSATAAGFFAGGGAGAGSRGSSPVSWSRMCFAAWLASRGLLERVGMADTMPRKQSAHASKVVPSPRTGLSTVAHCRCFRRKPVGVCGSKDAAAARGRRFQAAPGAVEAPMRGLRLIWGPRCRLASTSRAPGMC